MAFHPPPFDDQAPADLAALKTEASPSDISTSDILGFIDECIARRIELASSAKPVANAVLHLKALDCNVA